MELVCILFPKSLRQQHYLSVDKNKWGLVETVVVGSRTHFYDKTNSFSSKVSLSRSNEGLSATTTTAIYVTCQ